MSSYTLLKDPSRYVPHTVNLIADPAGREYWLNHFDNHFGITLELAKGIYGRRAKDAITAAAAEFSEMIARLRREPACLPGGKLDILELCRLREKTLREHELHDPFQKIKQRENTAAIELYPEVVRRLHLLSGEEKWFHLVEGVFAGNIFDLGSSAMMHLVEESTDFLKTAENMKPRPWFVDDFDRLLEDLPADPPAKWNKAIVFVDNAGSDFVLGVMPFVRELALEGTQIILAANEHPSLNDMTAKETHSVLKQLTQCDDHLDAMVRAGVFQVVSTGNGLPLIDLNDVSDELNEISADADLVILEGMGRSVETNFDVELTVDTLNLALLKDEFVASFVGGGMFDCVCKYNPVAGRA